VGHLENGWRGLYLVGLGPLLLLVYWRRSLPETARFEAHRQLNADVSRSAAGARVIIAAVGGSQGLILESVLYGAHNSHWPAISTLAATMLFAPFLVARVFPETSGRTLEDITPER